MVFVYVTCSRIGFSVQQEEGVGQSDGDFRDVPYDGGNRTALYTGHYSSSADVLFLARRRHHIFFLANQYCT